MNFTYFPTNPSLIAVATIVALVGAGGLAGAQPAQLDDGTATVEVISPTSDRLAFVHGRFGTAADYLRVPDLTAQVTSRSGTPRIHYRVTVPRMGVDQHENRLIRHHGRIRVPLNDVAFPPTGTGPMPGIYGGRLVVRVQSFSTDAVLMNRSVRVWVPK